MSSAQSERTKRYWAQFTPEERKANFYARLKDRRNIFTSEKVKRYKREHPYIAARKTAPTVHARPLDIVWGAGAYEGEGCCWKSDRISLRVAIGQKDRWLCDRMRALFGGSVGVASRRNYNGATITYYQWQLSGPRARGFLMTIFTFVSPRRRAQIKAVLR